MSRRGRFKKTATPARQPMVRARFDLAQTTSENRKHWTNADGLAARAAISQAVRRVFAFAADTRPKTTVGMPVS